MTQTAITMTPAQDRIQRSMEALLARAGLPYQGDYVQVGEYRVHYLDYGAGPPLLLVHGGGAGAAVWYRQIAALSRHFRVIAPDNPIFGLSSQILLDKSVYDFSRDYLLGFMDALRLESAHMAGLSMGGFGCLTLAIEAPARVDRLAVFNSAGLGTELALAFRLGSLPVLGRMLLQPNKFLHDRFFDLCEVECPNLPDAPHFKQYSYDVTANDGHADALARGLFKFGNMAGQRRVLTDDELRQVRASTMIVWGEQDRIFPASHAQRAHGLIAGSHLHVLEDAGHVSIWDRADRCSDLLLEFLSP